MAAEFRGRDSSFDNDEPHLANRLVARRAQDPGRDQMHRSSGIEEPLR